MLDSIFPVGRFYLDKVQRIVHFLIFPLRAGVFALGLLSILSADIFAQVDTLELKGVEIAAQRFSRNAAGTHIEAHSLENAFFSPLQGVESWLTSRSNVVMRGYGPGSSYGLSLRGGSSGQTQIMLNGIPFEHPGLAQADLSLLPAVLFTDASVYRGSSGALLGNASVGGTVFFDTQLNEDAPLFSQMFSVGSFGVIGSSTVSSYRHKGFSGRTALYWQTAKNDFDRSDPLRPWTESPQPDAGFSSSGIQQTLAYSMSNRTVLNGSVWFGKTGRELPPSLSQLRSEQSQNDENFRVQGGIRHHAGSWEIDAKAALDHGQLDYKDGQLGIDESSTFHTVHLETTAQWSREAWTWTGMAIFRESLARTEHFTQSQVRSSPAAVLSAQFKYGSLGSKLSFANRVEWLNGSFLPMLPTVGITHCIRDGFELRASAGRVFRLPGLNDLYWNPGGNPDLLPETGWSQEAGIDMEGALGKTDWKFSITGFSRDVENWIIWMPQAGLWTPENLRRVWSRGVEFSGSATHTNGTVRFTHSAELAYVKSTHLTTDGLPRQMNGKQLIYIPVWSNFFSETVHYKHWAVVGILRHQSTRYTNTDNTRSLDPFILADLEILYTTDWKRWQISGSVAIRNLLDRDFQLAANRPMPGRYFAAGLQFAYKHPK